MLPLNILRTHPCKIFMLNNSIDQFTVIDQSEGQVKLEIPNLFYDEERASILKTLLLMQKEIRSIDTNIETNTTSIVYNANNMQQIALLAVVKDVLKNFSIKPLQRPEVDNELHQDKVAITHPLIIKGMSCDSCALFLEMLLSRNPAVMTVNINYQLGTGQVTGYLDQDNIIKIINENGYQAMPEISNP